MSNENKNRRATAAEIKAAGFKSSDFATWPTLGCLQAAVEDVRNTKNAHINRGDVVDPETGEFVPAVVAPTMPNIQQVVDRLSDVTYGPRITYRVMKAVESALEWGTLRGFVYQAASADVAEEIRQKQEEARATAAKYGDDDEFGSPESMNEGEQDVEDRSGTTLPAFPHELTLGYWGWLRFERNRLAKLIGRQSAGDAGYYPEPKPRQAVFDGVVRYQSAGARDRDDEELREKASLDATMTPTMRALALDTAKEAVQRAKAWLRKCTPADIAAATEEEMTALDKAKKSLTAAERRLGDLTGAVPAAAAPSLSAAAEKKYADHVAMLKDAAIAATNAPLADYVWEQLPVYAQYDCWEAVARVLCREVENQKRGRLTQLFNEDDGAFAQRRGVLDSLNAAYGEAADQVAAYRHHWQVLAMKSLREGTPLIDQQRDGLIKQ